MDGEDEAALLAELRAISQQSVASRRFQTSPYHEEDNDSRDDGAGSVQATVHSTGSCSAHSSPQKKEIQSNLISRHGAAAGKQRENHRRKSPTPNDQPTYEAAADVVKLKPPSFSMEKKPARDKGVSPSSSPSKTSATPPWKRKGKVSIQQQQQKKQLSDVEEITIAVASPRRMQGIIRKFAAEQQQPPPSTFQDNNDDDTAAHALLSESRNDGSSAEQTPATSFKDWKASVQLSPPWKRKARVKEELDVDVLVVTSSGSSLKSLVDRPSTHTSTFQGERGGAAEDAELLALLRGVSAKSAASRFDEEDHDNDCGNHHFNNSNDTTDAHFSESRNVGCSSEHSPTNNDNSNNNTSTVDDQVELVLKNSKIKKRLTPPWKRKGKAVAKHEPDVEVVMAEAPPPPLVVGKPKEVIPVAKHPAPNTRSITSNLPNTFQGERGGAAEDAELLALLRGVSAKSAASRFDDTSSTEAAATTDVDPSENSVPVSDTEPAPLETTVRIYDTEPAVKARRMPPWKQRGAKTEKKTADVVVAAAPPLPVTPNLPTATNAASSPPKTNGFKSEFASTFHGERGGAAEDAKLLALLREVSAKSGASRFDDCNDDDLNVVQTRTTAISPKENMATTTTKAMPDAKPKSSGKVMPWKRDAKRAATEKQHDDVDVVVLASLPKRTDGNASKAVPPTSGGIKSELPSTFKGDRGGAAEDAELLALLRGVSSQSSASRFSDTAAPNVTSSSATNTPGCVDDPVAGIRTAANAVDPTPSQAISPRQTAPKLDGDAMPIENVPKSLTDKNWKVRCQAYDVLATILQDLADASDDLVESETVLQGLDNRVPVFVEDSNAGALDKALEFANLYAEYCRGAGDAEQARKIVLSLVEKNAFSSRPSTLKLASSLTLKLMEVGLNGSSSVHSVVDALLTEGLGSKKPKVIQASASLILEAAYHFGASSLPLVSITSSAAKMLTHSNATVRDSGIKILAEICRTLGSKAPIQSVVDGMKKAQVSELDSLLSEQSEPTPVQTGLRSSMPGSHAASPDEALAALQAGSKELEEQRFASRPPVDVIAAIAKTEYASQITEPKWSQKVAALDKVLECGGEKPYKLAQPSPSVNYNSLIGDTKKLLSHTHFAVCSKAIQVLSMLAEGVGEKLYPHLRPVLTPLLQLSKDKKLTSAVSSVLDSFFGNVLSFDSLLDGDDAIPSAVDEKHQKNALARATALGYLGRCIERNISAGPKGKLSPQSAAGLALLCASKLNDSDASVRKACMDVLVSLQRIVEENISEKVQKVIETLQTSNARAYKTLTKGSISDAGTKTSGASSSGSPTVPAVVPASSHPRNIVPRKMVPAVSAKTLHAQTGAVTSPHNQNTTANEWLIPQFEDALTHVTGLGIPQWDASELEDGILVGLKASKWQLRHDAIESLRSYVESGEMDKASSDAKLSSSSILIIAREQTRGFKETNVNIMKAVLHLFIAVCEFCESKEISLDSWAIKDGAAIGVQKISDRKLTALCKSLLTAVCVVALPYSVLSAAFEELKSVKSPVAHEEFLKWFQTFCSDFGAASIGPGISDAIPNLIEELGHQNMKVKREACSCFALLHQQIGPGLKALSISLAKQENVKEQLQKCFEENPFNSSIQLTSWPRVSIVRQDSKLSGRGQTSSSALGLEVPKIDLFAALPDDIIAKLGSKDGKVAWKMRKEAMDEINLALNNCGGLIETTPSQMKELTELMRALRDRLTDTQINLRPTAACLAGSLLSAVEKSCQAKLGKLVFSQLINAAMNDIKKPMRDASLAAIRTGFTASSLDGGGLNELAIEVFVGALVAEVNESAIRAGGLPDILLLLLSVADSLPNLEDIAAARGQSLGEKYAVFVIECLTSSKSETRSAASSLLETSVENGVVSSESIKKATGRLKPALQRSVGSLTAKFVNNAPGPLQTETESNHKRTTTLAERDQTVSHGRGQRLASKAQLSTPNTGTPRRRKEERAISTRPSTPPKHPLIPSSGKPLVGSSRSIIWPDYPEEPHGSVLENLKRFWAPFLPPATVSALFPSSGIKKQDDAKSGIEMLTRALSVDRSSGSTAVGEQLDLILKWLTFSLCSKESTTGLQDILLLLKDVLAYLLEIHRQLSDSESLETIPFLLDKVSSAKGRFRDTYMEINSLIECEGLLPPKRLGMLCVAMIDNSPHAKARAQACHTCLACVEKTGLAAVGKKGVLSAAKLLSHETTTYRAAALDLMEVILAKMNGDINRLVRICGPNLSDKARLLLEERRRKSYAKEPEPLSVSIGLLSRRSHSSSPQKTPVTGSRRDAEDYDLYAELPRLSLRAEGKEPSKPSPRVRKATQDTSEEHPFAFSLATRMGVSPSQSEFDLPGAIEFSNIYSFSATSDIEPSGAAAALRARLLKIREKVKITDNGFDVDGEDSVMDDNVAIKGVEDYDTGIHRPVDFHMQIQHVRRLLNKDGPIAEKDPDLEACIFSLKMFHASLSRQQHSAVGLMASQLTDLRFFLIDNIKITVDLLRRLIGFTIHSGDERVNAGMLLPLLSLCLATLMALFRDSQFSSKVSPEELTLLIRETGAALLDARLSSSEDLNEDTREQMVRAINKLAVQAATGSLRHVSFQALMTLQLQLNLEQADESSDDVFTCRLSRVVTKLFARVIKAEEATKASYAQERVDMEVLICSMEDLLSACQHAKHEGKSGSVEVCSDMVKSLVLSIICAHGDATSLRQQMNELGIHSDGSELGVLVSACAEEISSSRKAHVDTEAIIQADAIENPSSDPFNCPQPKTPSKDVASLVSRLGRAPPGAEREAALEEIRNYKATYGEAELDAHLQQLSGAFRDFIEEQIKGDPTPLKEKAAYVGTSVSDRIRSLRSRLQATDLSVQTAVEEGALEPAASPPCPMLAPQPVGPPNTVAQTASTSNFMAPSWTELTEQIAEEVQAPEPAANSQQPTLAPILSDRPKAAIATVTSSNLVEPSQSLKFAVCTAMGKDALEPAASPFQPTLASKPSGTAKIVAVPSSHRLAPSPSKLLQPSPSKFSSMSESRLQPPGQSRLLTVSTSSSAQTLRERLAARHELREAAETIASATTKVESPTNSFGRAAALRARLEAVKQQSKLQK